jgi:hypothetical protein
LVEILENGKTCDKKYATYWHLTRLLRALSILAIGGNMQIKETCSCFKKIELEAHAKPLNISKNNPNLLTGFLASLCLEGCDGIFASRVLGLFISNHT